MINGISGAGFTDYTRMTEMRGQVGNPFQNHDSDEDGALDKIELSSFAEKISEMTGQAVDVDQLLSDLDGNEDGLVSREEFDAGRPQGPPPDRLGMTEFAQHGSMQGGGVESLLNMLSGLEDEDVSAWTDSLDTNADGIVDAEEAKAGISCLVQTYQNRMITALNEDDESTGRTVWLG